VLEHSVLLGLRLVLIRLEVFGPCCVHISFKPYHSSFGSGLRQSFWMEGLNGSVHTYAIQMNYTNRAIVPEFAVLEPKV